jgi:hypothetical protein
MRKREGRTEALAGSFNTQDVANTLWSLRPWGGRPGRV